MAKCKEVRFKHTEIMYLLDLALDHKDSGVYWGRRDHFEQRQDKVIAKLKIAANTKAPD